MSRRTRLALAGLAAAAAGLLPVAALAGVARNRAIDRARDHLAGVVASAAGRTDRLFRDADAVLGRLVADHAGNPPAAVLNRAQYTDPRFREFGVTDPAGNLVRTSFGDNPPLPVRPEDSPDPARPGSQVVGLRLTAVMGERSVIVARPTGRGRGSVDVLIDPRVLTYLFDESGLGPGGFLAFATDDGEPLTALGDGAGLATQDRIVTPAAGRLRAEAAVFDGVRVVAESDRGWAAGTAWADLLAVGPPVWGLTTALVWAILTRRRSGMGNDLLLGLRRGEFAVVYQPVVDLRRGNWAGLEAFLRWTHPDYGPVPPAVFIPVAERTGVIGPLSLWLVERAAADLAPLFSRRPDLYLGVNLPPAQLLDGTGDGVLTRAAAAGLPAPRLVIELTERDLPDGSLDELGRAAARLADRGARLALDDFGTGYANYATLSQVRFHLLKLDRSLTAARPGEPGDAILDAMLAMANRLGLAVVAEGLETAERAEHLRAKGVPFGQGWAFGRPVPADKLEG